MVVLSMGELAWQHHDLNPSEHYSITEIPNTVNLMYKVQFIKHVYMFTVKYNSNTKFSYHTFGKQDEENITLVF